jgi:hypothetical protein
MTEEVSNIPLDAQIEGEEVFKPVKPRRRHNAFGIAFANLISLGTLGYLIMGQKYKARAAFIYTIFLSVLLVGFLTPIIATIDGYLVAKKIQEGEDVSYDYCGLKFVKKLPMWTDMGPEN